MVSRPGPGGSGVGGDHTVVNRPLLDSPSDYLLAAVLAVTAVGSVLTWLVGQTSALITGGVGPWLPYQMLASGWVGMTAGWLRVLGLPGAREGRVTLPEMGLLAACGLVWGLLFGAITNLYFWPYASVPAAQSWEAGIDLREVLVRFGAFYAATSFPWDLARAAGNVALVLLLGAPMVRALTRFRRRFHFRMGPAVRPEGVGDGA